jgi:hypothetical protein
MKGKAADIRVKGVDALEVARYAESIGVKRIGYYDKSHGDFVHIGSATTKKFWKNGSNNTVSTHAEPKIQTVAVDLPVLTRGMKSDTVKNLQILLAGRDYTIEVDGSFGAGTEEIVKEFQKTSNLTQSGKVDIKTWKKLLGV